MRIKATCQLCGKPYYKQNGKSKYCSDECKKEATRLRQQKWREEHPDYQREWRETNPDAEEQFRERHPNYYRDRARRIRCNERYERICEACGKTFVTYRQNQTACSRECSRAMHSGVKRVPADQVVDKNITLKALYKRDNGVCYICGEKCDWLDVHEGICGGTYPSIDHVVPVSLGGLHSWDNVRLAHLACNMKKSNKLIDAVGYK